MKTHFRAYIVYLLLGWTLSLLAACGNGSDHFYTQFPWVKLLGTVNDDLGYGIAVDANSNAYITGYTDGDLDDNLNAGFYDVVIAKYDTSGNPRWSQLLGSIADDFGYDIAVDGHSNAYITGCTDGDLGVNPNNGFKDIVIAKYDTNGNLRWCRLLGSADQDCSYGIAVDSTGNCYITGETFGDLGVGNTGLSDIVIAKYDTNGNLRWCRLLGSTNIDFGTGIAVDDAGNCYITGGTDGDLGGGNSGFNDIVIAKYDTNGNLLWCRLLGSIDNEFGYDIAVDDAGNCYITGGTDGDLGGGNSGFNDIVIAKYDTNGNLLWCRLLGSTNNEFGYGIAVDSAGNCYITGETDGDLDGNLNEGLNDVVIAKYDKNGDLLWSQFLGSTNNDLGRGIAVDNVANCYVTGDTEGHLDANTNGGLKDIFIWKSVTRGM